METAQLTRFVVLAQANGDIRQRSVGEQRAEDAHPVASSNAIGVKVQRQNVSLLRLDLRQRHQVLRLAGQQILLVESIAFLSNTENLCGALGGFHDQFVRLSRRKIEMRMKFCQKSGCWDENDLKALRFDVQPKLPKIPFFVLFNLRRKKNKNMKFYHPCLQSTGLIGPLLSILRGIIRLV